MLLDHVLYHFRVNIVSHWIDKEIPWSKIEAKSKHFSSCVRWLYDINNMLI